MSFRRNAKSVNDDDGRLRAVPDDDGLLSLGAQPTVSKREQEFTALVREMSPRLLGYVAQRIETEAAQDVVADSLLVLWRRWDVIPAEHDERRAWVFEVAKRTLRAAAGRIVKHRRLESRIAQEAAVQPPVAQPHSNMLSREAVEALINCLPPEQDEALRLTVIDGMTVREAAEELRISPSALTSRLHRARIGLRARIRQGSDREGVFH